jgi:hypothetical protein
MVAWLAARVGSKLVDYRTGAFLGTAILLSFRGHIWLLGYRGQPLLVEFLPEARVTYWRHALVFRGADPVDFPSLLPGLPEIEGSLDA